MSRLALPFVLAAFLGFAAAACSDSEPPDFSDAIPGGAPVVDQDNLKFIPTELTVDGQETVYFTNSETALHTVTIDGENESGEMRRGEVFSFTFPGPGEYEITCDFHPQMRATITVN